MLVKMIITRNFWVAFNAAALLLCFFNVIKAQTDSTIRTSSKSFPITTLINAKWEQTPIHFEIAEYLADENQNLYWDFITDVSELETPLSSYDTESQSYNAAINVVRKRLTDLQVPLMKLIISMHSLTPRIQTHFQLASEILNRGSCSNAATFAQVGNELACSFDELRQKLQLKKQDSLDANVETYPFDHIYPGSENNTRTVILYGDLGSSAFAQYHQMLAEKSLSSNLRYITRHFVPKTHLKTHKRVRLSGYGVELYLKSTEYKSQDDAPKPTEETTEDDAASEMEIQGFDFAILKTRFPTLLHSLDKLRQNLMQGNDDIAQLKAWEFQDLGLQATQAVAEIDGEEALKILQYTAHNFPMIASTLLSHKVSEQLRNEVKYNTDVFGRTLNIIPPDGALFINGLFFDADTMDMNSLVETLRAEVRVLESLHNSKIRGALASALMALDFSSSGSSKEQFAIDIRDSAISWINDIETETQYKRWPASVMDLLRPTFPGMLRNIRKNVFNLVLVVDPLEATTGRSLIKLAESFVIHSAPVRLGLVFDARKSNKENAEDYCAIQCAFNYVSQKLSSRAALGFLTDIYSNVNAKEMIKRKHIKSQLKKTFDKLSSSAVDEIIDEDSDFDYGRQLAEEFVERLGFADSPQALLNGVPMASNILQSDSDFEEAIFSEIIQQTATLQKAVYRGDLTDNDPILDYLMNQPHVMPRLNQRILGTNEKFLDLSGDPQKDLSNVKILAKLSNRDMTATLLKNIKYFEGKHSHETLGETKLHFLTLWVIADLEKKTGKELLLSALQYVKAGSSVRVAFIPNAEGADVARKDNLNRLVWAAQQTMKPQEACKVVSKWLKEPNANKWEIPSDIHEIFSSTELHVKMLRVYSERVLQLKAAERLVIANGKIIGPLPDSELFGIEDFGLIDRFNAIQYADKLRKVLAGKSEDLSESQFNSDSLLKLYDCLVPRQSKTRYKIPEDIKEAHSVVKLTAKQEELPHFEINAVIDPASRAAQKLAPILILLRNTINCNMKVFLTPVSQHSDMPVKNFYRYVVEPEIQFTPQGELAEGPIAKFSGMPANPLLTQNIQAPENWLVESVRSVYDLDNIKLVEIGGPVHSEYELEYLLLEGHCFDASTGAPPRGLQVTLGTEDNPTMVDTIVMANLGYFQLKANPGVWTLRLREGKSADIYDITNAEGPNTAHLNGKTQVVISSLKSHVVKMRVSKKPGMQNADLLAEDNDQQQTGIWNSIASSFGGGGGASGSDDNDSETINIFSVASGHLYERLLRIMMLSVMKHTKSPVKFWFLKNYLSPQFTDFLPQMSQEYGFQYELVQYKWPRWLHQQTEKQRTIWGYKILFLDVLFPLNVRKIVFVDADAIVRADLRELYDMDLGGAPYAYTPFCDSRKEMEGFRFWKQGYWKSHLMGRRYHISALYVVDLRRFRKIAAGDRLRGQYQALSQDPNSLSNLDQDLPNNMIHQVAIKSLPDEWLWCQTWCSDSSFKKAKVIDLCNNPQTKEAKLTAAQRIVPEWKTYDGEIKSLLARIEDHENAEHNDLQDSGSTSTAVPDKKSNKAKKQQHTEHGEL